MDSAVGFLIFFPLFMVAVTVHELSHGWVALQFGDETALRAGRLTLNPLRHIDLIGTLLLPLFLRVMGAPLVFGWAKPVPIHVASLRRPKQDMLWVGAAGPAANFILAGVLALILQGTKGFLPPILAELGKDLALINLVLGTFNLFPIPPLDGSRVLVGLLPIRFARLLLALEPWGFLLVLLALALGMDDLFIRPVLGFLVRVLRLW